MKVFGGFGPVFILHCINSKSVQTHLCLQNEHAGLD